MSAPQKIGVYGGGRMGAGVAHAFLVSGSEAVVVERDDDAAAAAADRVAGTLAKAVERGVLTEDVESVTARLTVGTDAALLAGSELVVEAVPEDMQLKRRVLGLVEQAAPDAVLATNTSSLSIDEMAADLARPERFLGMHFFNPVPASSLIEIVVGSGTDGDVVEQVRGWSDALGKTPIVVKDSPGFASSRLGVAIALEAMRMVEDGVASAEDIDTAMTLGYKHPMGPLKTTDVVGLDVRLAIAEHLAATVSERFEPPQILRDKVAAGELGRKTGRGFYDW